MLASVILLCALAASPDPSRGITLHHQRQFHAAEKELRAVLAATPADASTRLYLARVLVELNRQPVITISPTFA